MKKTAKRIKTIGSGLRPKGLGAGPAFPSYPHPLSFSENLTVSRWDLGSIGIASEPAVKDLDWGDLGLKSPCPVMDQGPDITGSLTITGNCPFRVYFVPLYTSGKTLPLYKIPAAEAHLLFHNTIPTELFISHSSTCAHPFATPFHHPTLELAIYPHPADCPRGQRMILQDVHHGLQPIQ